MYQIICTLLATIAYGTATGHCEVPQPGTSTITFPIFHLWRLSPDSDARSPTGTITIRAILGFPDAAGIAIPPSSSFTGSAAIVMTMKVMSPPSCANQASPR